MSDSSQAELAAAVDRGLAAVEALELEDAEDALGDAAQIGGENHPRVLHLAGMIAWAQEDVDRATGFLMQAADQGPDRADIYLDAAECAFVVGDDLDEAEAAVRVAMKLPTIEPRQVEEARLLLAQIRLADDDSKSALEQLEEIGEELRHHPAYLSTRGAALMAAGRTDEAVATIEHAIKHEPDDPDFQYQLAVTLDAAGRHDDARTAMLRVLELDLAELGDALEPPDFSEVQVLRSQLEDVLEDLPEPLLRLVSSAPITVQARAQRDQVAAGADPRASIAFVGTAKSNDVEADLQGIVIMRDLLLEGLEDEDELPTALFYGLMEELRRFFKRDDLVFEIAEP